MTDLLLLTVFYIANGVIFLALGFYLGYVVCLGEK
jgi:hypothetical protein